MRRGRKCRNDLCDIQLRDNVLEETVFLLFNKSLGSRVYSIARADICKNLEKNLPDFQESV
jgi:hypothetical protein